MENENIFSAILAWVLLFPAAFTIIFPHTPPIVFGTYLFFWYVVPVLIYSFTWLERYPKSYDIESLPLDMPEILARLESAENWRYGGRFGFWIFYSITILFIIWILNAATFYSFSGSQVIYGQLQLGAWNRYTLWSFVAILCLYIFYYLFVVQRRRSLLLSGKVKKFPMIIFENGNDANAFLSLLSKECPFVRLPSNSFASSLWTYTKRTLIIAIPVFHYFTPMIGIAANLAHYLDILFGIIFFLLSANLFRWLVMESRQFVNKNVSLCTYQPLLWLAAQAIIIRDTGYSEMEEKLDQAIANLPRCAKLNSK